MHESTCFVWLKMLWIIMQGWKPFMFCQQQLFLWPVYVAPNLNDDSAGLFKYFASCIWYQALEKPKDECINILFNFHMVRFWKLKSDVKWYLRILELHSSKEKRFAELKRGWSTMAQDIFVCDDSSSLFCRDQIHVGSSKNTC